MQIRYAERMSHFPVYLFDALDAAKSAQQAKGVDVIDLGVGDPDHGSPDYAVEELVRTARDDRNHHYPSYRGLPAFRRAVATWYERTFGVVLDPDREVLSCIGSKSGMARMPLAFCNPGDVVLIPNPCYPAYRPGIALAAAETAEMPLLEKNGFLPRLEDIPSDTARRAKLLYLNYPGNPTAACANTRFFADVVAFARQYEIIVVHDAPYSEISFDGAKQPSFLQVPGAKEVGVEFNSCSKAFNMTGWRVAYIVGNAEVVAGLGKLASNVDMGIFEPIQYAAIKALLAGPAFTTASARLFEERRDVLVEGLNRLGWNVIVPQATFFMWTRVPDGKTPCAEFASALLEKAGVLVSPGTGFGDKGEGYIRLALTVPVERLREATERIREAGFVYG